MRLILVVLLFIAPLLQVHGAEVYLLSQPITRTDKITTKWLVGNLAADTVYRVGAVAAAYYFTESSSVAGAVALDGVISQVPSMAINPRVRLKVWSSWKSRKQIKEIANIPGVSKIRVLTSGQMDNHDYMRATLHSSSMVFIETDGAPPSKFAGSDWIHLDHLASTKLDMNLSIGGEQVGSTIEIPINKLFQGTTIDPNLRQEWIGKIKGWQGEFSIWQRLNLFKNINEALSIQAKLKIGDQVFEIGQMATGGSVHKMLGNSPTQRLSRAVRQMILRIPIAPSAKVQVKTADVLESASQDSNTCLNAIKRALGSLYIKDPV